MWLSPVQTATVGDASSGGAGPSGCVGGGDRARRAGSLEVEAGAALSLTQTATRTTRRLGASGCQQHNSGSTQLRRPDAGGGSRTAPGSGQPDSRTAGTAPPPPALLAGVISALMRRRVSFCCHNNRRFPLPPRAPAGFSISLQCGAACTGEGGRGVCAWHQAVAGVAGQGEAVGAEEAQGLRGRRGAKGPGPGAAGRGRGPRPGGRAFTPRRPLTPPSRGGGRPAGGPQRAAPRSRHSFRRLRVSGAQATGRRGPPRARRGPRTPCPGVPPRASPLGHFQVSPAPAHHTAVAAPG